MGNKNYFFIFLFFLVIAQSVFTEASPEWGEPGILSKYGLGLENLSHQGRNIECNATLRLSVQVPKPLGLYYQVSNSERQIIYRDNYEYTYPNKNEFWALIQFPEKGHYIISVYILDEGFNRLLYYNVNCLSGYKDGGNSVFVGEGFKNFNFTEGNLPSDKLLITTEKPLKLSFFNNEYLLKYNVGILDLSHKPKFIATEPNINNLNYYRYYDKHNCDVFLYFKKAGYYIIRFYADNVLEKQGGLLAEYVIHSTVDQDADNAMKDVFIDDDSFIPGKTWYETETRPDTAELDDYIKNTPIELRKDPVLLTAYFTKKAKTEWEKARAAYVWLQYFIHYDEEMAQTRDQTSEMWVYRSSIEGMLERRYAVCNGYARLFMLFCRLMDMEAVFIEGYLKGRTEGHAWNAVLIDNKWRLLDATGGVNAKQVKERNFLPNPYIFINSHFPAHPFWQLIEPHKTEEYLESEGFFKKTQMWDSNLRF